MKLTSAVLKSILSLSMLAAAPACMGTITDGGSPGVSPTDPDQGPLTPEQEEQQALCVGDGEAGGACEVTSDCNAPMVCSNNVCVGPKDPSYSCDPVEGIECLQDGESCINGLCIPTPGTCETLDDCPNGFVCESGQCQPERDGTVCADPGPGPDLEGWCRQQLAINRYPTGFDHFFRITARSHTRTRQNLGDTLAIFICLQIGPAGSGGWSR